MGSKKIILSIAFAIGLLFNKQLAAQIISDQTVLTSPIFGTTPLNDGNGLNTKSLKDPNWGLLPSLQVQKENSITGNRLKYNPIGSVRRDIHGNILIMDDNGNLLFDADGNAVIDSVAMGADYGPDQQNTPPPPPDDPIDVPFDGGVVFLIILALFMDYKWKFSSSLKKSMK